MDMFQNVNAELSRRFPVDKPLRIKKFSLNKLVEISESEDGGTKIGVYLPQRPSELRATSWSEQ